MKEMRDPHNSVLMEEETFRQKLRDIINKLTAGLTNMGFPKNEALILGELLKHRSGLTSKELSEETGIVVTKIYVLCRSLIRKGLVHEQDTKPVIFKTKPVKEILGTLSRPYKAIKESIQELGEYLEFPHSIPQETSSSFHENELKERIWKGLQTARVVRLMFDSKLLLLFEKELTTANERGTLLRIIIDRMEKDEVTALPNIRYHSTPEVMLLFDDHYVVVPKQNSKDTWCIHYKHETCREFEILFDEKWRESIAK